MRVAFVSDSYWPRVNGVSVSIQSFCGELAKRGHAAAVFCPDYPGADDRRGTAGSIFRFPSAPSGASAEDRLVRPDAFPAVARALDRFRPDIIYIQTEFAMHIAGRLYARTRGLPLVLCAHTDYEHYVANYIRGVDPALLKRTVRRLMRMIYRGADAIATPSHSMERLLRAYGIRKPIHVLPSGVPAAFSAAASDREAALLRRAALESDYPVLAGRRILLFAGRVTEEKGIDFLLPVLARVRRATPDVALLIAGDGPHRRALENKVVEAGLTDSVAFSGYLPYEDLPLVYAASDIFVFPSRTETLGLCTIEAMSAGLPVVAIGEMGTRDVMQGDNGGFMVKAEEEAFAQAIMLLLDDEALRRSKSAEARAWSERFGIAAATDRLLGLFAELLA